LNKETKDKITNEIISLFLIGFGVVLIIVVLLDKAGLYGETIESDEAHLIVMGVAFITICISFPVGYLIENQKKLNKIMKNLGIED